MVGQIQRWIKSTRLALIAGGEVLTCHAASKAVVARRYDRMHSGVRAVGVGVVSGTVAVVGRETLLQGYMQHETTCAETARSVIYAVLTVGIAWHADGTQISGVLDECGRIASVRNTACGGRNAS